MLTVMKCSKVWSMVNAFEPFEGTLHCKLAKAAVLYQINAKPLSASFEPGQPQRNTPSSWTITGR
jgi:hypothetical protein